jgi:hypothetical protein
MSRDTYHVTVRREDPWWVAMVDGVGATETRTVTTLKDMVRDLVVVMREVDDPTGFDVRWNYDLPTEAAEALRDYQKSRAEREAAVQQLRAQHRTRKAK